LEMRVEASLRAGSLAPHLAVWSRGPMASGRQRRVLRTRLRLRATEDSMVYVKARKSLFGSNVVLCV